MFFKHNVCNVRKDRRSEEALWGLSRLHWRSSNSQREEDCPCWLFHSACLLAEPSACAGLDSSLVYFFRLGIDSKTVNSPGISATRETSCKNLSILIHFTLLRPSKIYPHQPSFSTERSPNDFSASTGSKKRQWTMGPGLSFLNLKTHTLPLCM